MDYMDHYNQWRTFPDLPPDLARELTQITGDEAAIQDRFYRELEFGTGGLRGILGVGTNRMNVYTIRKATMGLGQYLLAQENGAAKGVVVGFDSRRKSKVFALEAGLVLAALGIKVHVFDHLCPTPELSFAVRALDAAGGIMITASHNPAEYNGYKVYGADGGQILPDAAKAITVEIEKIHNPFMIPLAEQAVAEKDGKLQWIETDFDTRYCDQVRRELQVPELTHVDRERLKVVYTALHGTGNVPVRKVLEDAGYHQVYLVESQMQPDGEFPTVKSPNPEEAAALKNALDLATEVGADVAMGTDPDADRVGIAARGSDGEYHLLTGNQVGALLVDFILGRLQAGGRLPDNGVVFKTIVTSDLGARVAGWYGVSVEDTLTGFKYIGERIGRYEQDHQYVFLFGYEESYGYLASSMVRDKDAVQTCLLIAEMAAWHKRNGKTLLDALDTLYDRVGYYQEELMSMTLPGIDGTQRMQAIMEELRTHGLEVSTLTLETVEDYASGERSHVRRHGLAVPVLKETIHLPRANVLKYLFAGGSWLAVRPSGTEPKIKFYLGATGETKERCERIRKSMRNAIDGIV